MQFQVTYIEFDFSSDDDTWGDVDPDYQHEITEETIGQIWEAADEEDLVEEITTAKKVQKQLKRQKDQQKKLKSMLT